MIVGYARVSSDGQTLDAQQSALLAAGADKVFSEKVSGLDRLARSTRDLLKALASISDKGAGFRSLADPMIDNTSPHGRLILAVLGALGEFERSMILARTDEGRKRAQARGVRFGRKPKLSAFHIAEALKRREAGGSR